MPADSPSRTGPARICVATFAGAHGVKGLLRLKTHTETSGGVFVLGPLTDETGAREFKLAPAASSKGMPVVRVEGVDDRTAAEALNGIDLYAARDALPPADEDEFYYADLAGLSVVLPDGTALGTVRVVQDFGAGPLLEVETGGGKTVLIPFTREAVPEVDVAAGRITADPPPGLLDDE